MAFPCKAEVATAQERNFKVKSFNGNPIIVHEVRNLQKAEHWFRDLEIEVKNISDQPVYFIHLVILFPDIPPPPGGPGDAKVGWGLTYGRPELGSLWRLPNSEDVALKPGETYVFTIMEGYATGLEYMKQQMNLPVAATDNIVIQFDTISFGDGTGYTASGLHGKRGFRRVISKDP